MKNYDTISTEKLQKYQHYYQEKLIIMNILQMKKYYLLIEAIIEQAKFTYSSLGKALEKETEKQVDATKSLDFSNKIIELHQLKSIFLRSQLIYMIID